jgi:hypothetical protein
MKCNSQTSLLARNFVLVASPWLGSRHNILVLIVKILDVLFSMQHDRLISVNNNEENTMIGHHGGLVTLFQKEVTNNILHVWFAPHQMDIVIKKVMKAMMDNLFYKIAHVFWSTCVPS